MIAVSRKRQIEDAIAENGLQNVVVTGPDDWPIVEVDGRYEPAFSIPENFIDAIEFGKYLAPFWAKLYEDLLLYGTEGPTA